MSGRHSYTGGYHFISQYVESVDLNAVNENGKSALIFAAQAGKAQSSAGKMLEFLISKGADPSLRDKAGKTALDYAMDAGDIGAAKVLSGM